MIQGRTEYSENKEAPTNMCSGDISDDAIKKNHTFSNTLKLINVLESNINNIETNARNVEKLAVTCSHTREEIKSPQEEHDVTSNTYLNAIQSTLTSVMTERDEVHAQLIASRVFHIHEMEQMKRKYENLKEKLFLIEKMENRETADAAAFFLGQELLSDSTNSLQQKTRDKMIQDSDEELIALCKQLSYEISCRVSLELEIIRLKENRKIEKDLGLSQVESLRCQLKRCNLQMEQEKQLRLEAEEDRNRWKHAFQKLLNNDTHEENA